MRSVHNRLQQLHEAQRRASATPRSAISGPPDRARSTTRSPASSPKRGSVAPSTVKYASPTLSPSKFTPVRPVASRNANERCGRCILAWLAAARRVGHEWSSSGQALAAGATLQAIEDVGQSLVALPVHEVEINPRVGKRATEAKD